MNGIKSIQVGYGMDFTNISVIKSKDMAKTKRIPQSTENVQKAFHAAATSTATAVRSTATGAAVSTADRYKCR